MSSTAVRSYSLLLVVLIFVGCGGECKTDSDCESKTCFDVQCSGKECVYDAKPDCCGNNKCEPHENKCTCPADCGACRGTPEGFKYLTNFCDAANNCVFGMDKSAVKTSSFNSGLLRSDAGRFEIDTTINQPFNVKEDILELKITLKEKGADIKNIRVSLISLIGENDKRQKVTLGQKESQKPIWSNGDSVIERVPLTPKTSDKESELKNAQVEVIITFDKLTRGTYQQNQQTLTFKYPSLAFVYVSPDQERKCPPEEEWDDGNEGTEADCSASTDFFVVHHPIPGACGNYVCDPEENRCTCPTDCGPCQGKIGTAMDIYCSADQECLSRTSSDAVFTANTIFNEKSYTGFKINAKITHGVPLDLKGQGFTFEFESAAVDQTKIGDIKILDVRVFYDNTIAMEKSLGASIVGAPVSFTQPATLSLPGYEEEISLTTKVWVEYEAKSSSGELTTKFVDYSISMGKLLALNPGTVYR